eukprot:1092627-Amphidinium_carterae.1
MDVGPSDEELGLKVDGALRSPNTWCLQMSGENCLHMNEGLIPVYDLHTQSFVYLVSTVSHAVEDASEFNVQHVMSSGSGFGSRARLCQCHADRSIFPGVC